MLSVFELSDPESNRGAQVTARELLDRAAERVDRELRDEPEVQVEMWGVLGRIYGRLGLYTQAVPLLTSAVERQRRLYGDRNAELALNLRTLGYALRDAGKDDEAETRFRQALATRRAVYGDHDARVAESLHDLAQQLHARGSYVAAESVFASWLALRKSLPTHDDPQTAKMLIDYGLMLDAEGDYVQAEPVLREAVRLLRRHYGNHHLELSQGLWNLGMELDRLGRFDEGAASLREGIGIRREKLGDSSVAVADITDALAQLLAHQGDYASAERLYQKTLAVRRGRADPILSFKLSQYAEVLRAQDRLAEAEPVLRDAVARQRARYGEQHLFTASILERLATVVRDRGNYASAESLFRQGLTIYTAAYHGVERHSTTTRIGLARLYVMRGDPASAEPILRDVLRLEQQAAKPRAERIVAAKEELGHCLTALGRYPEAEALLLASLHEREHASWALRRGVLRDLVALYDRWPKPAESERYRAQLDAPPVRSAAQ